jgi:hypothetical protein
MFRVALFPCVLLALGLATFAQDKQTTSTSSQASWDDCTPAPDWQLIYPGSSAFYVGGTIPEMHMGKESRLHPWAVTRAKQFHRKGHIALTPRCLLFAFKAEAKDSITGVHGAHYSVRKCSNDVKLADDRATCAPLDGKNPKSYLITIPYAKVNLLSRAKYSASDLAAISMAYAAGGAAVLAAIYQSISKVSAKEQTLGAVTLGMAIYYYYFIAKPRLEDNYMAVFVEPPSPPMCMSRASNLVTVETSSPHYFRVGQQIQISDAGNTDLAKIHISEISRDEKGNVTVTTKGLDGLTVGEQVQIADVIDPSFNGQFQVVSVDKSQNTFTYEQEDKPKAAKSEGGKVQDVWNGTFLIESVPTTKSFTYWQVGPDEMKIKTTGTATVVVPVNTNLTVAGNLAAKQPTAANPKSVGLTGTATLTPPPSKSDELFKKGDLLMFRIPNAHDYYNISMTLSGETGLTFVSETAEKPAK